MVDQLSSSTCSYTIKNLIIYWLFGSHKYKVQGKWLYTKAIQREGWELGVIWVNKSRTKYREYTKVNKDRILNSYTDSIIF